MTTVNALLLTFNLVCLLGLTCWTIKLLYTVPEGHKAVVERFGRFHKLLPSGIHVILPLIDKVRCVYDISESTLEIKDVCLICRDDVIVLLSGTLFYKIVDPIKATYAIGGLKTSMESLWGSMLKSEIEGCYLSDLYAGLRNDVSKNAIDNANRLFQDWGVTVQRFVLEEVKMSDSCRHSMENVYSARCEAEGMALEAKIEADKKIAEARAKANAIAIESESLRDSVISVAKSKAEAIELSNEVDARNLLEVLRIWAQSETTEQAHEPMKEVGHE